MIRRVLVAVVSAFALVFLPGAADRPVAKSPSMAEALTGVWVRIGEPGNIGPPPASGGQFKFRIDGRWTFTSVDGTNGMVRAHFGGTYRVVGNEYFETISYSTDDNDPEMGNTLKFTVKVEGDTMTQTGVNNSYTEVWKRVR